MPYPTFEDCALGSFSLSFNINLPGEVFVTKLFVFFIRADLWVVKFITEILS